MTVLFAYLQPDGGWGPSNAGLVSAAAADDIEIGEFADWTDPEQIAANVVAAYREFGPALPAPAPLELFTRMASWLARH